MRYIKYLLISLCLAGTQLHGQEINPWYWQYWNNVQPYLWNAASYVPPVLVGAGLGAGFGATMGQDYRQRALMGAMIGGMAGLLAKYAYFSIPRSNFGQNVKNNAEKGLSTEPRVQEKQGEQEKIGNQFVLEHSKQTTVQAEDQQQEQTEKEKQKGEEEPRLYRHSII